MLKGQVQVDEAYIGGKFRVGSGEDRKSQYENKTPVVVLVETNGRASSKPLEKVNAATLRVAMIEKIETTAQICTDDLSSYPVAAGCFDGGHQTVNHSEKEYARKQLNPTTNVMETITTNTAECYFSLLKRGVYGTFHHVSKQHLHRYCAEFDFRWNGREISDSQRRDMAVKQIEGKRVFYREPIALP